MRSRCLLVGSALATIVTGFLIPQQAFGQEVNPDVVDRGPPAEGDIIVTARRREERLQDIPVAVTAVSGESLVQRGVTSAVDLAAVTPSLTPTSIFSSNHVNFTIRGQAPENNSYGNTPTVEVYFADVPQMFPTLSQLYDIDSVQIVRGPQGTLFGRASNGGAVLFTPKRPGFATDGYVSMQYGNYNDMEVEGAVTVPVINDVLSVRAAGAIVRRDGYAKILNEGNYDLDNKESNAARLSVEFRPSSNFKNHLVFDYVDVDQHQGSWLLLAARPTGLASQILNPANPVFKNFLLANPDLAAIPGVAGGLQTYLQTIRQLGPRKVYSNTPTDLLIFKNKTINLINTSEIDVGPARLKNIFGYQTLYAALGYEADASPFPLLDGYQPTFAPKSRAAKKHQFSDEVQLTGSLFNDRLDWLVGGYYENRKDDVPGNTLFGQALAIFGGRAGQSLNLIKSKSRALFTQETFRITPTLSLTGGFRHTWDRIDAQQYSVQTPRSNRGITNGISVCSGTNIPFSVDAPQCLGPLSKLRPEGDNWTVSLDWKPIQNLLAYISTKRGYRPGGVSTTVAVPALREFGTETITEYEAGLKSSFDAGSVRGRLNVAGFYQEINDAQRGFVIFNTATNQAQSITLNAEKAEVKGIEIEGSLKFGDHFELSAFTDYTDAGYKKFQVPNVGPDPAVPGSLTIVSFRDASQNPFPNVPKWHFGATGTVTYPTGSDDSELALIANYFYQSKYFFSTDAQNEPEAVSPGHGLVNARIEWRRILGGRVTTALWAKNLFDKFYLRGGIGIQQLIGITQSTPGEPRTYGAQVRFDF